MQNNILIIGGGPWGKALSTAICSRSNIFIKTKLSYDNFTDLPKNVQITRHFPEKVDIVLFAIPSIHLVEIATEAYKFYGNSPIYVIGTKGIEHQGPELFSEYFYRNFSLEPAFISGPNFAKEILLRKKCASVIASKNTDILEKLASIFASDIFSIEATNDVITVQISGCYKNIAAFYLGYVSNFNEGENYMAKLCTDSIREMAYISGKLGGRFETCLLYSGIGDIILSSYSTTSRNYTFGRDVGAYIISKAALMDKKYTVEAKDNAISLAKLCKDFYHNLEILPKVVDIVETYYERNK